MKYVALVLLVGYIGLHFIPAAPMSPARAEQARRLSVALEMCQEAGVVEQCLKQLEKQ